MKSLPFPATLLMRLIGCIHLGYNSLSPCQDFHLNHHDMYHRSFIVGLALQLSTCAIHASRRATVTVSLQSTVTADCILSFLQVLDWQPARPTRPMVGRIECSEYAISLYMPGQ